MKKCNCHENKWTTEKEIKFIQGLSKELLMKYYATLPLRKIWGEMDKDKIFKECKRLLK